MTEVIKKDGRDRRTTNYKTYINALRNCAKEHENDITPFAHIKVSMLCSDVADLLEGLEQEPILDKIRAEIEQVRQAYEASMDYIDGAKEQALSWVLEVIDKYKAGVRTHE